MTGAMTICSRARIEFLKNEHLLPEFRFTVSLHDGPNRLSDWRAKQTLTEASISDRLLCP